MDSLEAEALGTDPSRRMSSPYDPDELQLGHAMSVPAHLVGGAGELGDSRGAPARLPGI